MPGGNKKVILKQTCGSAKNITSIGNCITLNESTVYSRGKFRNQTNIYDGALLRK